MNTQDQQKQDDDGQMFSIMPIAQDNSNSGIDALKANPGPVNLEQFPTFPPQEDTAAERQRLKEQMNEHNK